MLSGASGNGFGNGFLAGAFGNLASKGAQGIFEHAGNVVNAAGTFASGAVIGGLVAEIGGGNFWDGFRNGAITAGLNHVAHFVENRIVDAEIRKMYAVYKNSVTEFSSPAEFYQSLGGDLAILAKANLEEYENTCAARLSNAINHTRFRIPAGTPNTFKGGDGNYYFISAIAMKTYLSNNKIWGQPTFLKSNYNLKNGVFFQTGFGGGVTGHLDVMYRGDVAHEFYNYDSLKTYFWH